MPGIGAYNSMGGMSTMNFMYQNLAANRRQNNLNVETEGSEAVQSTMENESASAMRQPPPPPPPQETEIPDVGSLSSASETLAQMRVRSTDAADEAYEMFRAGAGMQGVGQMPPPPPPEDGERPVMGAKQMELSSLENTQTSSQGMRQASPPPPQDGMPQAGGMGRMTSPPPSEDEFPAQQFTEQEEEEVPLAATAAGIA